MWTNDDLRRDQDWIQFMDDEDNHELRAATIRVAREGRAAGAFGRADFPLPRMALRLGRIVDALEHGRGVVLLRGLALDGLAHADVHRLYWGLLVHLGQIVPQNAAGDLIGQVTDRGGDYHGHNTRGYTTRAQLRPHCDITDVVTLLCVQPARRGGQSHIASSLSIYNEILRDHPEYLPALYAGFYYDLRGEGVTADPDEVTRHRVPVYSHHAGRLSCRYNGKSILEGMAKVGAPLDGVERAAVQAVGELALRDDLRHDMALRRGDLQLLLNHSVLHGRFAYEDEGRPEDKRLLLRAWINTPNGRPLEPRFAERLNTGPRGGVFVRKAQAS